MINLVNSYPNLIPAFNSIDAFWLDHRTDEGKLSALWLWIPHPSSVQFRWRNFGVDPSTRAQIRCLKTFYRIK